MVILLHYRWLFIKGNVFISEWGKSGVEIFLHYSRFFVKGDFIIGGVECNSDGYVVDHLKHDYPTEHNSDEYGVDSP